MPRLQTKEARAAIARSLAKSYHLVEHKGTLYMPVHFMTKRPEPDLVPTETVWMGLYERELRALANMSDILFLNSGEEQSFRLMVSQLSEQVHGADGILVRVGEEKIMLLGDDGRLIEAPGTFIPNYLDVPYQVENPLADELYHIICDWVGGEQQAESLLNHLSTALQSKWSAVKYILLIGVGRNGKSTLLKMITALFGAHNISGVKRQDMSANSTIMTDLNGKLLNVIMDGPKEFLKENSTEKTLVAGEPYKIRLLYENVATVIQTNALFIEGLQQEPKVSDKSPALQKRLVRFRFPNVYELNLDFEEKMLQPNMLAALLSLLLAHWVNKSEVADKLALTVESLDMQMEAVWAISPVLRYLEYMAERDMKGLKTVEEGKMPMDTFLNSYRAWLESNGYKNMEDDFLISNLNDHFEIDRKTIRVEGKPTTRRVLKKALPDTKNAITLLMQGGTLDMDESDASILMDEGVNEDVV